MTPLQAAILISGIVVIALLVVLGVASDRDDNPKTSKSQDGSSISVVFGLVLAIIGIALTAIGILVSLFIPEVRQWLGLQ